MNKLPSQSEFGLDAAPSAEKHKFRALDGLRGVAALAVAIGHARIVFQVGIPFFGNTALAVDFFFILSGFVLSHAYGTRLSQPGAMPRYLLARVLRLYPLVLAGALLGFTAWLFKGASVLSATKSFLHTAALFPEMSPNPFNLAFTALNPPAWSLFFEMLASVLFGFGVWRKMRLGWMLLGATALAVAVAHTQTFDAGYSPDLLLIGLARVSFGFGMGAWLFQIRDRVRIPRLSAAIYAVLLMSILAAPPLPAVLGFACVTLLFPALVLGAAWPTEGWRKLSDFGGEISYPIYILHWPIYLLISQFPINKYAACLLGLASAAASALLALRFYDEPVRRILTQSLKKK